MIYEMTCENEHTALQKLEVYIDQFADIFLIVLSKKIFWKKHRKAWVPLIMSHQEQEDEPGWYWKLQNK